MSDSVWIDQRVDQLKAFWADGASASVIASKMGLTRNAVLGKVHRLGLEKRSNRNGAYYGPKREVTQRTPPKRIYRNSVFKNRGEKTPTIEVPNPNKKPGLMPVMSALTGAYVRSERKRAREPEYSKNQLRAQLAQAMLNTARMA